MRWCGSALSGPAGSAVIDLARRPENSATLANTIVVRSSIAPDGWLLVLAQPRFTSADLSPRVRITRDGAVHREWMSVRLTDGEAAVPLQDAPPWTTRVRVGNDDGNAWFPVTDLADSTDDTAFCGGCGDDFFTTAEAATRSDVARALGLSPDEVNVSVRITGRLDPVVAGAGGITDSTSGGVVTRVLVATSTIPGGSVVRTVVLSTDGPNGGGSLMTPEQVVPIDAETAADRPFVYYGLDPKTDQHLFQVFAPTATRVKLSSDDPARIPDSKTVTVTDGSAIFRLDEPGDTEHRQVVTYDASGHEIGRWPLQPANLSDPLDVQGP